MSGLRAALLAYDEEVSQAWVLPAAERAPLLKVMYGLYAVAPCVSAIWTCAGHVLVVRRAATAPEHCKDPKIPPSTCLHTGHTGLLCEHGANSKQDCSWARSNALQ